jgi:type VI secretion system secreted protein Hcp
MRLQKSRTNGRPTAKGQQMDVIILDVPGIDGECQFRDYANKIECLSFSHAVAMQVYRDASSSERTTGKLGVQEFTLSKYMDRSSPVLNQACCEARKLGDCKVTVGRNDDGLVAPLMEYSLIDVMVSSVSVSSAGGDKPAETLTLNFTAIEWEYSTPQQGGETPAANSRGAWNTRGITLPYPFADVD